MQSTVAHLLRTKGAEVFSIGPDATVFEALEDMANRRVGALLVLDGQDLAGIISERDYARKVILLDRLSKETRVREIMTTDVFTVSPTATLQDCMTTMTDHRIRHLPVVEDGQTVGVVSIGDVVAAVIDEQAVMIEQLEGYINAR